MPHGRRPRFCRFALLVLALVCQSAGLASAEDWPRWRGPRADGTWQAPPLADQWPAEGLKTLWKTPIGGGYAGVSVAGNLVLVLDRQTEPEVERVLAFDLQTGKQRWEHHYAVKYGNLDYGNGPRAAATIDQGRVYTLGAQGHVFCLDAASGRVVWSSDTCAQYQAKAPEWGLAASPVVWRNLVIVHVGAPGGCLLALDRDSGKRMWASGDDPAGYATPIVIAHPDGEQLVAWTPEHVLGLDPATGRQHWSMPYKSTYGVSIATPLFAEGIVLVSGYWEGTRAIRLGPAADDAKLAWASPGAMRGLMSAPLERDGCGYLLDKRFGLTCFEFETGKKLWDDAHRLTPRGQNPQASLVGIVGTDRVLALNSEGDLVLARLDRSGYQELARAKIIGPTWAHPGFAGRRVLARDDHELVCVELPVAGE